MTIMDHRGDWRITDVNSREPVYIRDRTRDIGSSGVRGYGARCTGLDDPGLVHHRSPGL